MPNPNPVRRPRLAAPETLPPGYDRHKSGLIRYRYTDPRTGRRRELYGATIAELEAKLRVPVPVAHDPKLTVAAYLRSWSASRVGVVRSNTQRSDDEALEHMVIPYLGERLRLADLSEEHVSAMLGELARHRTRTGRPYAPRTIAIARATLRKALAAAVPSRIPSNPATNARLPRSRRAVPVVGVDIAVPTIAVLRAVEHRLRVTGDPLYPLFLVASTTGLRQSELLGLRWSAIDLERGRLEVRDVLVRDTAEIEDPKSRSSARAIRLAPLVVDALRARRQSQRLEQVAAGTRWSKAQVERDLVFTDPRGDPLRGRQVTRRLQAALTALELPRYDWKSLRHAYVTGLLEDGVDLAIVSKSAGHSSVDITSDVYAHFTRRMQEQVSEIAAARVLGG